MIFLQRLVTTEKKTSNITLKTSNMKLKIWLLIIPLFLLGRVAFAQQKTIKGVVMDEQKQPVDGVSIVIQGKPGGQISNADGEFKMQAEPGDLLILSNIGYKTRRVPVTSAINYNIILSSTANTLSDAVVIGYQTIKRKSITTAISSVSSKDIAPSTSSNVGNILQGKVPGLQVFQGGGSPGSQPKILVRGFATITGGSNPLIVVDGVITSYGGLNDINPADIETVDVLKDAASTAIYGSRGGEGVILITTKKGIGKTKVNFSGNSGVNRWTKPHLAGTKEYVDHYTKIYEANKQTLPEKGSVTDINTDWWDETIRDAYTHDYSLSLSGGKNGLSFYGSVGYFDQTSNYNALRNTGDYQKITSRFNVEYEISKMFKVGVNLAPRYENYGNGGGTGLLNVLNISPNVAARKSAKQTEKDVNAFAAVNQGWDFTAYNPVYSQYTFSAFNNIKNPLAAMARDFANTKHFGTQGSAYLQIKPIKNLTFKSSLSGFYNSSNATSYTPKYYIDPLDNNINSSVYQTTEQNYRWQLDNTLNYITTWKEHHLNVLLGQSADNYIVNKSYVHRQDIPYDADPYRYISAGATLVDASGNHQPGAGPFGKMSSYFARLQYNFKETYYLAGSFRADGSSLLSPKNRWGYFPTISGAYILTNEKFMKAVSWLDYLKLRASFGRVGGNLPGSAGAFQSTLGLANYINGDRERIYGYTPYNVPDANIKWETTQDLTIGIDANLLKNKLSVSFDKYWRSPKDMLLYLPIQPSLGYPQGYIPTIYTNVGSMRTSGYEGSVNYKDKIGKVNIGAGLTFQHFLSKAIDLKGQVLYDNIPNDIFAATRRTKTEAGDILGQFYGYKVLGIFQNDQQIKEHKGADGTLLQPNAKPGDFIYKNINGDNTIDLNDRTSIGNPYPKLSGGLTLQASYSGFDLRFELYGSYGNKIANDALVRMNPIYNYNFISGEENKYWSGEGSTNTHPILSLSDLNGNFSNNSTFFIQDGSFLRCKLIQLGYTLPKDLIKWVDNIRVYASAQNLFTITKYKGLNPEVPFGGILHYGIDNGQNPIPKYISMGLNVNF